MTERESIETLRDVVSACAIMMPQAWRESHLADAKEAVETLAARYKVEEIREAIDWFQGESLACGVGLKNGMAAEEVCKQLRRYTLAIEALSKELGNETTLVSGVLEEVEGAMELKKCPHCGSDVMLCRLNGLTFVAYEFSIVCPGCGLETKIACNPSANCCFDMATAVNEIIEKWNRRDGNG